MSREHRNYFNQLADRWPDKSADESMLLDWLQAFNLESHDRVLDVGAGCGIMTRLLRDHGPNDIFLAPMDISEQMLAKGKRSAPLAFRYAACADVQHASFRDDQFNKIICFSVFPHFTSPVQAAQELYRILKPGGTLFVLHSQCSRKLNALHASLSGPVVHDELMQAVQLQSLFAQIGFRSRKTLENPQVYWVEAQKPFS